MKTLFILLSTTLIGGCVNATMTKSPNSEFGPVEQVTERKGTIEFLDSSHIMDSVRKANRKDAYKQMFEVCDSKYTILREYAQIGGELVLGSALSDVQSATTDRYTVIDFQCL